MLVFLEMSTTVVSFEARGKVQNVMFRQTLIRAAQRHGLEAGASNDRSDRSRVVVTLQGKTEDVNDILAKISSGSLFFLIAYFNVLSFTIISGPSFFLVYFLFTFMISQ